MAPLVGGACQDNFRVDLRTAPGELGTVKRLVLRSDAKRSLPGSLGRREEFEVIRAAVRHGVPTPRVFWLAPGLVREGADAYFMEWVDGESIGAKVVRDPSLAEARRGLPDALAGALARIHAITPADEPGIPLPLPVDPIDSAIRAQYEALDRIPEPHPGLELALRWLRDHKPDRRERTLVHGDFRTGNFIVAQSGLAAVLDWEFAHFGDPMEDVAWLCVRDWRFGQLAHAAGGIARRETFFEAYERACGRTVPEEVVHYWEVMGNVRWAIGAVAQGLRYSEGHEDLELIAIARRALEMEFEALRLIEKGP